MEASAIVCDRGVRWRRRSGDHRPTRWAMPQKNAASRQNDKGAATMIKQPALAHCASWVDSTFDCVAQLRLVSIAGLL
jgi:hypothetical protein